MTNFNYKNVFFIGIGGISMSSLARILHNKNISVCGSDIHKSEMTEDLVNSGINVFIGHNEKNIPKETDLVIYTAAISQDNPEYIYAKKNNIKMLSRSELLGIIMKDFSCPISVSGTHGKTSTSSILSEIFMEADKNPTITIGGILPSIGGTLKLGNDDYFIVESCEYKDSFLDFYPKCAIVLNIDRDHTDYFKSMEQLYTSFKKFCDKLPEDGILIINRDIENYEYVIKDVKCKVITYSEDEKADYVCKNISFNSFGCGKYDVYKNNEYITTISLNIPGKHNVLNSLACFSLSYEMGLDIEKIKKGIFNYKGVNRRFELKGCFNDVRVIDDYAHHPTEVMATLKTGRSLCKNKLYCVFQPHTYSRTKSLFEEFTNAFDLADKIILLDIYSAREKDTGLVHSKDLAEALVKKGKDAEYIKSFDLCTKYLQNNCKSGDMVILTGAGDVNSIAKSLIKN